MIDGDAIAGSAWNGDVTKARKENPNIHFVYPQEGFVIWVDCLAIPTHPPHLKEAYQFINFLLNPQVAAKIALTEGYAMTNLEGMKILPKTIVSNPISYPEINTLKRGTFQRDLGEETLELYNQYWQKLKLAF